MMRIERLSSDSGVGYRPLSLKVDQFFYVELDLPLQIAVDIVIDRYLLSLLLIDFSCRKFLLLPIMPLPIVNAWLLIVVLHYCRIMLNDRRHLRLL